MIAWLKTMAAHTACTLADEKDGHYSMYEQNNQQMAVAF